MTIYLSGAMTVDRPIPENLQKYVLDKLNKYKQAYDCVPFYFDIEDDRKLIVDFTSGDYIEELNNVAHYLENNGFQVLCDETEFSYCGDYDGGYLYENGEFQDYDIKDFILRTTPVKVLMDEIRARGYEITVSKVRRHEK